MSHPDNFYKDGLRTTDYDYSGDAYDDERYQRLRKQWSVYTTEKDKYLNLVRTASETLWTHLRLLADFMEIGRVPRNWTTDVLPEDRQQVWRRANIRVIHYSRNGVLGNEAVHGGTGLDAETLKSKLFKKVPEGTEFRLYLVEDLSRNVIEVLGTELKIDPEFFTAQIADYSWHNIRDRWKQPQPSGAFRKRSNWFQIRWMRAQYFETEDDFEAAMEQAKDFNILRRPDHDVGVLLLDPTVSKGLPLWRGQRNFHPIPTTLNELEDLTREDLEALGQSLRQDRHKHSLFKDFVYWAGRPELFKLDKNAPQELIPVQVLLRLVISDWLTICDYTKTRLNQIELEINPPPLFSFSPGHKIDAVLVKLHICRKFVPLYREMVLETLQTVFKPFYNEVIQLDTVTTTPNSSPAAITACKDDFDVIMRTLDELQSRIDALNSMAMVVTALEDSRITAEDTQRANRDARNLGLLTWLATFFLPFGFVSGILSLRDRSEISVDTVMLYFEITLPLAFFTLALGWAMHTERVRTTAKNLRESFGKLWKKRDAADLVHLSGPHKNKERTATRLGIDDVEKGTTTSSSVTAQSQSVTMR